MPLMFCALLGACAGQALPAPEGIQPIPLPCAMNDSFSVFKNSGPNEFSVLTNDLNFNGQTGGTNLSITAVSTAAQGVAVISGGATKVTYTPNTGFAGQDTFTYTMVDTVNAGSGPSTATVTVTVLTRPCAMNDFFSVSRNSGPNELFVLTNDLNFNGQTGGLNLAITGVSAAANGTAVISGGATRVTYTPNADFTGQDSFTYTMVDTANAGDGPSTATVTVTVQP